MPISYRYLTSRQKNKIYTIGILHFMLMCFGLWSLVTEMIDYEEPITYYEGVNIALHYSIHTILLFCLIVGTYVDIPYLLVPWLGGSLVLFTLVTAFSVDSIKDLTPYNISAFILNFICVGACWFSWYTVWSYFIGTYKRNTVMNKKCFV
ncbi:hypothetical protein NQ318_020505 [Aromia moschata]|uniref:Uncharacterized protein n=1 Tax=Aromia moschata TaxID=1265417 RepID=A0AAV8YDM6_9CUCU|nr:hypothetical protein NQ318_020505 [Aromia moschata]